jgi:acylphosphatase
MIPDSELAAVHAVVQGRVQGVFFRDSVSRRARELALNGYVRNLPGGEAVEVRAEGERNRLEQLVNYLHKGPAAASVKRVETDWSEYTGDYSSFNIRY